MPYRSQSDVSVDGRWMRYAVPCGQRRKKVHQRWKKKCVCWFRWRWCQDGLELDSGCCLNVTHCPPSERQTNSVTLNIDLIKMVCLRNKAELKPKLEKAHSSSKLKKKNKKVNFLAQSQIHICTVIETVVVDNKNNKSNMK